VGVLAEWGRLSFGKQDFSSLKQGGDAVLPKAFAAAVLLALVFIVAWMLLVVYPTAMHTPMH
jgi:hypothetical protein